MPFPRTALLLSGLFALATSQTAQAADTATCLSQPEVEGIVAYALPLLVDAAVKTCAPRLSPDGYLATQGASLVQRYAARKATTWPIAKAALLKLTADDTGKNAGNAALMRALPDSALQPFADVIVVQAITKAIKADDCAPIERITGLLAPLPPENTSALVTTIIALADTPKPDGKGGKSGLHVCPVAKG